MKPRICWSGLRWMCFLRGGSIWPMPVGFGSTPREAYVDWINRGRM